MGSQPTKIGKYDVIRVIGRGGMGMVYGAVDPTIGRMVAIKQVTAVLSDDPDLLKRFYREAQSTGKLQHPNIVTLHDLGEQDGVPYLVMEYLEGDSLDKIIREQSPFTLAEKLNIIIQVCEGLAYAHQRQIVHRDIKPGNIVVLTEGGVKIVDFGIAQFGNERFTRTGQIFGSLYYMSPEQIQDGDVDSRCDIYSTGVVLYEFLTGALPFRGRDATSTLAKILHDSPPSLAGVAGSHSAALDEVIRRALAKDRNSRYASMDDFAFDLRSIQEKLSRDMIAASLQAAESCIEGQDWEKAREQLRQVLKLDKQHRRANELLREVQGQIQRQQVVEKVRQLRMRADEALGMRNWEEALALLDQAVKIDSSNSQLAEYRNSVRRSRTLLTDAMRRAESAHNAGNLEAAKQAVEEALNVDPSNTTAKALNAILAKEISERSKRKKIDELIVGARKQIALRQFTPALELLHAAEVIDASESEVQQLIRSATAGREHEKQRQALEKACTQIEELLNRDEYTAACDKADEALRSFPQDLGLLKLRRFAEAQREAWSRRQYIEAQMAAARQLADSEQFLPAQSILNETLERYPDDSGVISLLGIVTDGIAHQEAQRREAERQANERRRYIRQQVETAAELQRSGQTVLALKNLREGVVRYPDSEELRNQIVALEDLLAREEAARARAEQEAKQKKAEIEKTIADSWQLLSSKQIGQAAALLEQALRRHPESEDLKSHLEFAQRRLAVEQAERERAEQEARRRRAEIQKELAVAQLLLENQQVARAVTALEQSAGKYPESEELRSLLQVAQRRLAAEQAERERAEKEQRRIQAEIQREIAATQQLLEANRTSEAVARLEQLLRRYPESEELRSLLQVAQRRLAAEQAERERAEKEQRRIQAEIQREIAATQQLLEANRTSEAVARLEQMLSRYSESEELRSLLQVAERRLAAEQAERERAEKEKRRIQAEIQGEIAATQKLLEAKQTNEAIGRLEPMLSRYPESEELRSLLQLAQRRLAAERAERERAEEKRRIQAEIQREIAATQKLLEAKQTSEAVARLERLLNRYPDSEGVELPLRQARQQLAAEKAAQEEAEAEERRRRARIEAEITASRQWLDSKQAERAVTSLQNALHQYPENEEIKAQLELARRRLALEQAQREEAERKAQRRRQEIEQEIATGRELLAAKKTEQAVISLDKAVHRFPDSTELRAECEAAKNRLAAEEAARQIAEAQRRRSAEIEREILSARQLLESKQTELAVAALESAVQRYADSLDLKKQLELARQLQTADKIERERAAQEARRRLKEIENEISSAKRLLVQGGTAQAIAALEGGIRKYPESGELKSLLESARLQLVREREERLRAEEEDRRRKAEIDIEVTAARKLLESKETSKAVASLERATRKYPENRELQSLFVAAQEFLSQEQAAREKAAREAQERRGNIAAELEAAKRLLKTNQTPKALLALEEALKRYPESNELRSQLVAVQQQHARETEEREAAERRRAQIKKDSAKAQSLLDKGQADEALSVVEAALNQVGKDRQLQGLLESAKAAVKLKRAQEKKRAAQIEQAAEQRRSDLSELRKLGASVPTAAKPAALEKLLRRADEIAAKYPNDAEMKESLAKSKSALEFARAEQQNQTAVETPLATKMFAKEEVEQANLVSTPTKAAPLRTPSPTPTWLPKILNKWTVIAVCSLLAAGLVGKYFLSSKGKVAIPYVVIIETQPSGASVRVGNQTCVTPDCSLSLPDGKYKIDAELPGYQPLSQDLVVDSRQPTPNLKLVFTAIPHPETAGYLVVKTGVAGADVLVNKKNYGRTDAAGAVRLPLDPGQYTVEVQKKGYELAQSQHVLISRGTETPAAFALKPLPNESELVITGAPPDAQVQVDGQELGFTGTDGRFLQSVEPGKHEIVLVKAGKKSNPITEKFTARKRLSLDGRRFIISQPPPVPSLAQIVISNLPRGATVKVDGGESHQPDASGTARFEAPAGNHSLEISAASFTSKKIERSFGKGETALDGSLEHVDTEKQQYEAGYQRAFQQYQQANDKKSLEAARDTLQSIAQSGGSHAADARKYVEDINKKIAALNAPPAPPPVKQPPPEQDEAAIRALVNRYEQAFDARDADALLKIWPNMGNKKYKDYKNTFAAVSAFHMQVDLGAIKISGTGETATASAVLSQAVTVKGGGSDQGKAHRDPAVFELTKSNGNWIINNVR